MESPYHMSTRVEEFGFEVVSEGHFPDCQTTVRLLKNSKVVHKCDEVATSRLHAKQVHDGILNKCRLGEFNNLNPDLAKKPDAAVSASE